MPSVMMMPFHILVLNTAIILKNEDKDTEAESDEQTRSDRPRI